MKKLILICMLLVPAVGTTIYANKCVNCASGSSCQQCRLGGKDTFDARKRCEKMGCKITGTGSCSTAANVKVCG
ncbi:hypothetical protein [Turneriella parva]|uniref:Uncharacterized protein n=1 Tax=Turneriella parva (strain ATCC BAA-1111 / DSM 21527 / NCTC 11395 / H) TaxID=869212 RepID=I4B6H4_TURPD|nr:hypothetical protein [Turneriella parva]AFM12881.1 hypothetical protein Turpa_2236 [Turneriella parva DSM 21527]